VPRPQIEGGAEIGIFSLQIDEVIACLPSGRRVSILLKLPKQSDKVVANLLLANLLKQSPPE